MDNAFAVNVKLPAPAFLVNVFRCLLLVYSSDCRVVFFSLERTDDDPSKRRGYTLPRPPSTSLSLLFLILLIIGTRLTGECNQMPGVA